MSTKLRYSYIFLCLMLVFSSCITYEKINYMQEPGQYSVPTYTDTLSFEEYRIRYDDQLYVRVYSTDEKTASLFNGGLSGNNNQFYNSNSSGMNGASNNLYFYLVHEDGTIDFPTVGKVYVHGLTTREVKQKLEGLLVGFVAQEEGFSNISCEVTIVNKYFSIIGAQQSGRYPIVKEKLNIFEALAAAGDISDLGDKRHIYIVRQIEGKTKVRMFDIRSKDIVNSEFYYIEPNDVIYIRNIQGYSFGLTTFPSVLSLTASTISFGAFMYIFVREYIVSPFTRDRDE